MPVYLSWQEVTIRLTLTVLAGLIIGYNRGEHGRPAGMRTTLLVCLAASLSMIQANLLLATAGKHSDSFVVLDLMRLPLGILSGMGFIGAGAILRKDNLVLGVTTAATLWFTTVLGLCFGGGQWGLGTAALALGFAALSGLKHVENLLRLDRRGAISLTVANDGISDDEIRQSMAASGCRIIAWGISYAERGDRRSIRTDIERHELPGATEPPACVAELARHRSVQFIQWQPQGLSTVNSSPMPTQPQGVPVSIRGPD